MEKANCQELLANEDQKKLSSEHRQVEFDGKKKKAV